MTDQAQNFATDALMERLRELLGSVSSIRLAMLFGSLADGCANFNSDLDIAVLFDHPLCADEKIALIEHLAEAIKRPVDLIDLHTVGQPLLGQIMSKGRRIMGSDECFAKLLLKHLYEEADFMPYQRRILKQRRQAWIGR